MNREERRRLQLGKPAGRRLPGVNIGSLESRYAGGVPLAEQVDQVVSQAAGEVEVRVPHLPGIAPLTTPEGAWGVFCLACSAEAHEYVYPCEKWPAEPPQMLYETAPPPTEV